MTTLVIKNDIEGVFEKDWLDLLVKPDGFIHDYFRWLDDEVSLQQAIESQIVQHTRRRQTPNNWDSVFLRSLLDPNVLIWLEANLPDEQELPQN